MDKMLSFELWLDKFKMGQTISEFIVICSNENIR